MLALPDVSNVTISESPVGFQADLAKARYAALLGQMPLLHLVLCVNMVMLCCSYFPVAPRWLVVYAPSLLIGFCATRLAIWARRSRSQKDVSAKAAMASLRSIQYLAAAMGVVHTAWTLALYGYGDPVLRSQLIYTVGITTMCAIFTLKHVPRASIGLAALALPALLIESILIGDVNAVFIINCLILFSVLVTYMVVRGARNFEEMVRAQRQAVELADENRRIANTDSLTGLANRREFFARLDEAIKLEGEDGAMTMGVIDLDGFKPVNDLYGHSAGDRVLRECATRIVDFAGMDATVARLGGDEFGLFLRGRLDQKQILSIGSVLCAALKAPTQVGEIEARVSASIGFARYPEDARSPAELYECADFALYVCKEANRGEAVLFSPAHAEKMRMRAQVEQGLRRADLEAEISVEYQPLFNVADRSIVAFEALARWNSPVLGAVPPQTFIPVAENNELIHVLTRTIMSKALRAARNWPPHVNLSLNLSIRDLLSGRALSQIIALIKASGFDPARIDLEITETALVTDFERAREAVDELKRLGVNISLDDFGTGFSSLAYIHRLPLDKIKIDRSFIEEMISNDIARDIVKSMIDLCGRLGLDCVSEGVETSEQLDMLDLFGCTSVQGFLLSRPIAEADVPRFIAEAANAIERRACA